MLKAFNSVFKPQVKRQEETKDGDKKKRLCYNVHGAANKSSTLYNQYINSGGATIFTQENVMIQSRHYRSHLITTTKLCAVSKRDHMTTDEGISGEFSTAQQ